MEGSRKLRSQGPVWVEARFLVHNPPGTQILPEDIQVTYELASSLGKQTSGPSLFAGGELIQKVNGLGVLVSCTYGKARIQRMTLKGWKTFTFPDCF